MKRREIIQGLGAIAGGVTLAAPAVAQQGAKVHWRLASVAPTTQDILHNSGRNVSKFVAEATGGQFIIDFFGPNDIVPPLQIFDAVSQGTIEMGYYPSYFSLGKDPAFALGSSLPFGPTARIQRAWFRAGGLDLLNEFYANYNTVMFPGGNTGAQMAGWFRRKINSKEDLAGLKMRVAGLGGEVMSRLGVIPQQLPTSDVYSALERGTIDAVEVSGPFDDERFGFDKVCPYYYYPGFNEGSAEVVFFVNSKAWNALSSEYKAILRMACNEAADIVLNRYDTEQTEPLKRLIAKGVQLSQFPAEIAEAARPVAMALYEEFSRKSPAFKKIYEHYRNFTKSSYQWFQVAEYAHETLMIRSLRN